MENKSTTSESSTETYFRKKCKEAGMRPFKMLPTFEAGIPDRLVLYKGVSGFAELKKSGKKPKKLQAVFLDELEKAGSYTGVIDSKESADWWIKCFKAFVENKLA